MNHGLRLLYLLPADGFGGAERQGVQHLVELPHHGVHVGSFVGPSDALELELSAAGVRSHRLPNFPPAVVHEGRFRVVRELLHIADACFDAAATIERQARELRPEIIFANRSFAWLVAGLLSRRLRVPFVIRAGSRPAHPILGPMMSLLDHIARPSAVFYNCRAVRRSIASRFDCPAFALPNVVDGRRFASASKEARARARAELGIAVGSKIVGLAARPAPEKGFDFLERVVVRIAREDPEARFVVAGDFALRKSYEERLASVGAGNAVRFLGHVDAATFFRAVDVVVLTSRARSIEASPNALLEAMASSLPVVATGVGGVPELVRHGIDGYLTADDDVEGFVAHVVRLLGSPSLRAELGRSGRIRALAGHRPSTVVAQLVSDLHEVVASHRELDRSSPGVPCESNTLSALPSI